MVLIFITNICVGSVFKGISCPRAGRIVTSQGVIAAEGEPFGDEALSFTKDLCMQREVRLLKEIKLKPLSRSFQLRHAFPERSVALILDGRKRNSFVLCSSYLAVK